MTTATILTTAIIVGFCCDKNPYEFLFAMTHWLFDLADKPDYKTAKYSFCFCCLKSTKSIPHYSYNVFSCGFQKSIHSCLIFFEFYGDLHSTMTMMMKLFQTTSPFNYELHTMIDNTSFLLLNYVPNPAILYFHPRTPVWLIYPRIQRTAGS